MQNVTFDLFERLINNINLEVLEHGHFYGDTGWKHMNITSPFCRLYFMIAGEGSLENERHKVDLVPGNLYLIPPHTTYNYQCNSKIEKFYIHFRAEVFNSLDIFEILDACVSLPCEHSFIEDLLRKAGGSSIEDIISCKALLFTAVSRFMPLLSGRSSESLETAFKYSTLSRYIKENCSMALDIKDLSEYMKIPASALSKRFKSDTGMSLKNYVTKFILQAAKERLILTDLSIKEIAYGLGFSDEFYFSRFMKRHIGMAPKEYRAKTSFGNNHSK